MARLTFSDGVSFDTSGPLRVEWRADGYYVVGHGMLCAVDTHEAGDAAIARMQQHNNNEDSDD